MIIYNSKLKSFTSTLINDANYSSGFSSSDLGDSKNIEIVENFFKSNHLSAQKIVVLRQIHSVNIFNYEKSLANDTVQMIEDTDGSTTMAKNTALIVRNADCVPLLMVDKTTGLIGISHQGWRGSLKNMAAKMVTTFLNQGSKIANIVCAIGPAIGACCYDVDDDHYYEFLGNYEQYSQQIFLKKKGRWHISLNHLNYLQLIKSGVKKDNVDFFPFCTKCDENRFFSKRRAQSKNFPQMFNFIIKF